MVADSLADGMAGEVSVNVVWMLSVIAQTTPDPSFFISKGLLKFIFSQIL